MLTIDPENVPYNKDPDDPGLSPVEKDIILALKGVYDPEIPVDIYELGLIYALKYNKKTGKTDIHMTLTAPGCPVAGVMPDWVKTRSKPSMASSNAKSTWNGTRPGAWK